MPGASGREDVTMNVRRPAEAGKAFEKLFAAGDLEGLMELYEPALIGHP
jgi:hypothetical protein